MPTWNDEPCFAHDELGHNALARVLYQQVRDCQAPFVLGIGGTWGSGKTSFLRRLYIALGGEFDAPPVPDDATEAPQHYWRWRWFDNRSDATRLRRYRLIWFNAWHHQFEGAPLVALLHEIRQHFSLNERLWDSRGRVRAAGIHAGLAMLDTLIKSKLNLDVKASDVYKAFQTADAEAFGPLSATERFRSFFEKAVETLVGKDGRLIVFVDDLDRCEGERAFALLEALKLYLNADRCVFVLGMDREHLERNIAPCLKDGDATTARAYLGKIFQNVFLLPTASTVAGYLHPLVTQRYDADREREVEDAEFLDLLNTRYSYPAADWDTLVTTLDTCLPHNPRKAKAFVLSWKTSVRMLAALKSNETFDWRLSLVLHYLGQFEEPLLRQLEEDPSFYEEIFNFCDAGHGTVKSSEQSFFTPILTPYALRSKFSGHEGRGAASPKTPRTFTIAFLVKALGASAQGEIDKHLLFGAAKTEAQA